MSALALAFQSAGYTSPAERLHAVLMNVAQLPAAEWDAAAAIDHDPDRDRQQRRLDQVAKEALRASPRNWDGAKDALYSRVRNDAELLWQMFAPYRNQAVQLLLTQAAAELRELERPKDMRADPSASGQRCNDSQLPPARRAPQQAMDAVAAVARLSLLDTFTVNGKPIGDLTASEANRWASSRERDARFVRLLTANLPPDAPIRKFRTGEDTQAIYEQASQEDGDAG